MSFLLDTHVLLWWLNGDSMTSEATEAIADPGQRVMVSAASMWEIAIKSALGKLNTDADTIAEAAADDFDPLPVHWRHATAVGRLPPHHRDPFDRLLMAQAQIDDLTIITHDRMFAEYEVGVLWA